MPMTIYLILRYLLKNSGIKCVLILKVNISVSRYITL